MTEFFQDLIDLLLFIPQWVYKQVGEGIVYLANAVPAPFTASDVTTALSGIGGDVVYFLGVFEFDYGLTAVFGAYSARFLLRRIPFIG